jgi:hypothetical protein
MLCRISGHRGGTGIPMSLRLPIAVVHHDHATVGVAASLFERGRIALPAANRALVDQNDRILKANLGCAQWGGIAGLPGQVCDVR